MSKRNTASPLLKSCEPGKRGMTGKHGNHWRPPVKPRIAVTCQQCGAVKHMLVSLAKGVKFCSQACNGKSRDTRVTLACAICGATLTRRAKHANGERYCSIKCLVASKPRQEGANWRDPEKIRAYMRAYSRRNKETVNARVRMWGKANRDKKNELQRARRAAGSPKDFTLSDWAEIKRTYGDRCLRCGSAEYLQADHVVAVARGGIHHRDNIQLLCRSCNAWKGAKTMDFRGTAVTKAKGTR